MIANSDIPTYLEICRQNPNRNCVFINKYLSCFRVNLEQNSQNFNIIMDTLFEWIAMIGVAYRAKTFITSPNDLLECCRSFMRLAMSVVSNFVDFDGLDAKHNQEVDVLIRALTACENEDLDTFLSLSNGRYEE